MGFDWEEILGAEGEDLDPAHEALVAWANRDTHYEDSRDYSMGRRGGKKVQGKKRKQLIKMDKRGKKRRELLMMDDRAFIDRILTFPDRELLDRDENGKRRRYPLAGMAVKVKKQMEKDPNYRLSGKQKFAMANSFAEYSTEELKVSGIKSANIDPDTLVKEEIKKEGAKTVYSMKFRLQPEPDNQFDKNAVAVYADNIEGGCSRIGYMPLPYIQTHSIKGPVNVNGTLTDYSNGKFKNVSYAIVMGIKHGIYVYKMDFSLNAACRQGTADYLNMQCDWTKRFNKNLATHSKGSKVDNVRFEFANEMSGSVVIESYSRLDDYARRVCDSYFRYILNTGVSDSLKKDKYVDVPQNIPAVSIKDDMCFHIYAKP